MKKNICYIVLFFLLVLIVSCGVYKEPCEGVVSCNIVEPNI